MTGALERRSRAVLYAAALLLVGDLFLGWHRATAEVVGTVRVEGTTSGWETGWGFVAGVLAIGLVVLSLTGRTGGPTGRRAALQTVGSLVLLVATLAAAFTGDASVAVANVVAVETSTLWPAWAGIVLAAATVVAAFAPHVSRVVREPATIVPHGSP